MQSNKHGVFLNQDKKGFSDVHNCLSPSIFTILLYALLNTHKRSGIIHQIIIY